MIDKLNKSVKSYLTKKMIGITNHFFVQINQLRVI